VALATSALGTGKAAPCKPPHDQAEHGADRVSPEGAAEGYSPTASPAFAQPKHRIGIATRAVIPQQCSVGLLAIQSTL
jgi:hypothetical protein